MTFLYIGLSFLAIGGIFCLFALRYVPIFILLAAVCFYGQNKKNDRDYIDKLQSLKDYNSEYELIYLESIRLKEEMNKKLILSNKKCIRVKHNIKWMNEDSYAEYVGIGSLINKDDKGYYKQKDNMDQHASIIQIPKELTCRNTIFDLNRLNSATQQEGLGINYSNKNSINNVILYRNKESFFYIPIYAKDNSKNLNILNKVKTECKALK